MAPPSSRYSPSAIASTDTFIEWVVVYWSNSLSWSSGSTMACSACIAIESERTTASASTMGILAPF